ncbi:MAG: AAA family ATPase [Lachnospiraceae bacterium]|nr:AAA family ATPase [Lachnospiraceae bacterium]
MINDFNKKVAKKIKGLSVREIYRSLKRRIKGQGKDLITLSVYVMQFLKDVANKKHISTNLILTAPSGCGKTETYRAINDLFIEYGIPIPVIQIDATDLTENGIKGKDTEDIAKRIAESFVDVENNGYAIVFIDEIDKITTRMENESNRSESVQSQILTLIEGRMLCVSLQKPERDFYYNSSKTMFICTGAYQDLRKEKAMKKQKGQSIGFMREEKTVENEALYDALSLDDLIENGMKEELAGRFTDIINYKRLDPSDMKTIIEMRKEEIENEMDCTITLGEKAVEELLLMSNGPMGVRKCTKEIKKRVAEALGEYLVDDENEEEFTDALEVRFESLDEFEVLKNKNDNADNNETEAKTQE